MITGADFFFFLNLLEILKIENDWKGRGPFIFKYIPNLKDQISPKMRRVETKTSGLKENITLML